MRKFKNKSLPRGIQVNRGYVWIRFFPKGLKEFKRLIGPISQPGILDLAVSVLNDYRELARCQKFNIEPKEKRITLKEGMEIYMDIHGKKKAQNGYGDKLVLNRMAGFFGNKYLDLFEFYDVEKMRAWVEENGSSFATANRYQATLSCLFNKLKRAKKRREIQPIKLPEDNPCEFVTRPSELGRVRNRILTFSEYHQFLDIAMSENKTEAIRIFKGALMTMLRRNDLVSLKIENVNHVSNRLKGIQSKTGKPYCIYIMDELKDLITTAPPGNLLFDFTNWRPTWERLKGAAGLGMDFQFRDLRRSAATWLYKKGASMKSISHYLGHQSEMMTRRYIGISGEDEMIAGQYMSSIFKTPRNAEMKPGEIIPAGESPVIDVAKLEIPWIPEYADR